MVWIKWLHVVLAFASVSGFVLRLTWSYIQPERLNTKLIKIAPHVNDTLLLLAGLTLAFNLPGAFSQSWLIAKFVALFAYIGYGVVALRGTGTVKLFGAVGALCSVAYIFWVAYTRQIGL